MDPTRMPAEGFKNVMDGFDPYFMAYSNVHATACRELLKKQPSPSRCAELADVISRCEGRFGLLREFRQTQPELNRMVEDLLALHNKD